MKIFRVEIAGLQSCACIRFAAAGSTCWCVEPMDSCFYLHLLWASTNIPYVCLSFHEGFLNKNIKAYRYPFSWFWRKSRRKLSGIVGVIWVIQPNPTCAFFLPLESCGVWCRWCGARSGRTARSCYWWWVESVVLASASASSQHRAWSLRSGSWLHRQLLDRERALLRFCGACIFQRKYRLTEPNSSIKFCQSYLERFFFQFYREAPVERNRKLHPEVWITQASSGGYLTDSRPIFGAWLLLWSIPFEVICSFVPAQHQWRTRLGLYWVVTLWRRGRTESASEPHSHSHSICRRNSAQRLCVSYSTRRAIMYRSTALEFYSLSFGFSQRGATDRLTEWAAAAEVVVVVVLLCCCRCVICFRVRIDCWRRTKIRSLKTLYRLTFSSSFYKVLRLFLIMQSLVGSATSAARWACSALVSSEFRNGWKAGTTRRCSNSILSAVQVLWRSSPVTKSRFTSSVDTGFSLISCLSVTVADAWLESRVLHASFIATFVFGNKISWSARAKSLTKI